jgi:hypothetical protein
MKTKPDRKTARELRRAKYRYFPPDRLLAEMFLGLARRHRHPLQQDLLVEYMTAADGLDLTRLVSDWPDSGRRVIDDLDRLSRRLDEHAKANPVGEGDDNGEGRF